MSSSSKIMLSHHGFRMHNKIDSIEKQKIYKWDRRFMSLCDHISSWSEDPRRKVGAVIVGNANTIISTGYNGLARGIDAREERLSPTNGEKYLWMEHAERNAIYNAARLGMKTEGCRMYCNLFPCADCARAIVQSGIKCVVTAESTYNEVHFANSMAASKSMLIESGVDVRFFQN